MWKFNKKFRKQSLKRACERSERKNTPETESGESLKMIKVIIKPSYGALTLTDDFLKKVKEYGYDSIYSIEARTDERLIALVEAGNVTVNYWENLNVVEVDTSQLWSIQQYDGAESIYYLEYEVVREDINYIEMQ